MGSEMCIRDSHCWAQNPTRSALIESGFVPSNDEERLFMAPPQSNRDVSNWKDDLDSNDGVSDEAVSDGGVAEQQGVEPALQGLETEPESNPELDELRRRLEGLL